MILKIIFKIKLLFVTFIQPDIPLLLRKETTFPAARPGHAFLGILWIFNALKLTCLSVMLTIWDCGRAHGVPSSAPYKWVYKAVIIYDNENRYHNKIHYESYRRTLT
jgi:hypothetical protein